MGRDEQDNTRTPLKAMLWEEAKGKLRALVAVQGGYTTAGGDDRTERWQALELAVSAFIVQVEDDGLHE